MKKPGAIYNGDNNCVFTVWAPEKEDVKLHIVSPKDEIVNMQKDENGYFEATVNVLPGAKYFYHVNGKDFPDPASFFQPEGVHGPSAVVNLDDNSLPHRQREGLLLKDMVLYELHVGTFTAEGTFDAIIPLLDDLLEAGINTLELMPVSQFPGERNWGYDGVFPYAVQNSYGGPYGLQKLVAACHERGMAVFLDVVYNHMGPEGNYLSEFGPYFTDQYCTPWGDAINLDRDWSDGVKDYFIGNILYWLEYYNLDGLRLDAVHYIIDNSAENFWDIAYKEVNALQQKLGRPFYLIAESDLNDPKVVKDPAVGGWGMDAQWLDDFHHALYVLLDKDGKERYADFGAMEQLAKAYKDGFVHSGEYVSFRKRKHGSSSAGMSGDQFVAFNQNHDQVGNRVGGERLSLLVDFERQKLAAACLLLSPYIPLLFMGEEYGEDNPFFYFVSHSEKQLIEAVRAGRRKEFESFIKAGEEFPDPQDKTTFERSRLQWDKRKEGKHRLMLDWYKALIKLRQTNEVLQNHEKGGLHANIIEEKLMLLHRQTPDGKKHLIVLFNFSDDEVAVVMPSFKTSWLQLLDSNQYTDLREQGNRCPQQVNATETIRIAKTSAVVYG
jgi:maltooligosyltrehalose trehalohydrolase